MSKVAELTDSIRSKNAGPFWLTIDLFCGTSEAYKTLISSLSTEHVAKALGQPSAQMRRFDIPSLNVIKFSLPRPVIQGSRLDRDLHGAQWATTIGELKISPE